MNTAIQAYEDEYKRWSLTALPSRYPISQPQLTKWVVVHNGKPKTGGLYYDAARSSLVELRQRACEAAAAKAEEAMQISYPDWFQEFYATEMVA